MYVIKRTSAGGGYVARPGSRHSYTRSIDRARLFRTRDEANDNRCVTNEIVVPAPGVCGYCGSAEPLVYDDPGRWPYCPDCQGV